MSQVASKETQGSVIANLPQALGRLLFPQEDTLQGWREKIFLATILCSVVLGAIALVSSLDMALRHAMWGHFTFYLTVYFWAAAILLARRLPFKFRAWCGVGLYFTLGLVALLTLGPAGSGRSWFFAACVLASLLLGLRAGVAALAAITISLFTVGHFMGTGQITWPLLQFYSPETWRTTNYSLILVCAIATVSQAVLIEGLGRSLDKERAAVAQLEAAALQLQAEAAERAKAEADLRRHRDGLEDIVKERTAQLELTNQELQMEVAAREQAEMSLLLLASGVAHNFNNILMAVLGNVQAAQALACRRDADPDQLRALLGHVEQAAQGGRGVVSRLSRFVTRGQGSHPAREAETLDLAPQLRSLASTLAGMNGSLGRGLVKLSLDLAPGLHVKAVPGDLMEVFLNLVKNAREAMPDGGRLQVKAAPLDNDVVIHFTDTGDGADPQTLSRFFDPFFTTKGAGGQGLGLAVSRAIVASHGGEITAHSQPGQGATLTVRLPLSPEEPKPLTPPPPPEHAGPRNILLVEDEGLVALGIAAVLRGQRHQVRHVTTMASALEALADFGPDLVICDLGLPDATGWDVCAALQDRAQALGLDGLPLVVVSGWEPGHLPQDPHLRHQPFAFLQKPVERAHLLEVVGRAARSQAGR